ncbi:aconitase family protein [Streptomyces ipomoeae]|uniref:aconitase family protein n=1 Tax=Streptomyces ipomoeae TaxID=103232 RepID=UPI0029B44CF3|nr:aconitase family protein [Streptomyces ipomoeae]MDX2819546.1 aconitase family protein [Streptomyces ipomoeae]MDX2873325.1 aconitase family protein [Streptomyces ipomoeae]
MNADRTTVLTVEGRSYGYQPLDRILRTAELDALPYAIRVLLENVARRAPEALAGVVSRARAGSGACEVPVRPNRIMLHDTTCLPALADFAALRDSVAELGGDPERLQPSIPVDLTVDHSVIVEEYGRADAVERNLLIDFRRNGERYEMVKWAERSVRNFRVVPPGTGIIHQVNMEALARVVWQDTPADGGPPMLHPDLLVATDSHTPMINALGVVGWGVGGLEGQAAMLGEPVTIPYPDVVGVRLTGKLRQGVGATDLALTLTELLRATGVVNKFVEFCGDGVTTDHISPAGAIPARSAAGQWLTERGVARRDLNQYSTRRSNHEVMLRGAFTNAAVTNLLLDHDSVARPGPGGHARTADGAHVLPVHQAAPTYREAGHDLVVVAGRNHGAGSSRDWAAKAQALLGVRAVIAESYERIHRSNLIGMGVLPLEFAEGDHASSYPFTGERELSFEGLDGLTVGTNRVTLHLRGPDGRHTTAGLRLRVFSRQELEYLRHGGILPYVVRRALASS